MQVSFLKTVVLDHKNYVDLVQVDGKLLTQVMTKSAEPNIFGLSEEREGDHVDDVVNNWKGDSDAVAT